MTHTTFRMLALAVAGLPAMALAGNPAKPRSNFTTEMEKPLSDGDGTVPEESGRAPQGRVKFIARMKGVDHQSSYSNPHVQSLTLYCIAKIAGHSA